MKPFDPTKPCQTRDGRTVTKLTNFEIGEYPLRGIFDGIIHSWTIDGKYIRFIKENNDQDLVNIPEAKKIPLGYDDIMPGDLIKNDDFVGKIVWKNAFRFSISGDNNYAFEELGTNSSWQISKDGGKTWQPFYKEIEI